MKLRVNEPMSRHTSLRIGGRVREFFSAETVEELAELISACEEAGKRYLVLGKGSNVLFGDGELDITVISTLSLNEVTISGCTVTAGAGAGLTHVAELAARRSLTGLEFAYGIPGTVGGGVFMNAGAYGGELKDVIREVTVLENGRLRTLPAEECGFSYRHSAFQDSGAVIVSARIELEPGDRREIRERMRELMARRAEKQPLEYPSCGSTFKRPAGGYAAKLIEDAGLKGLSIGGAQVSEKHAGFLINRDNASFADYLALMERVREEVAITSGILLEPEVRVIR